MNSLSFEIKGRTWHIVYDVATRRLALYNPEFMYHGPVSFATIQPDDHISGLTGILVREPHELTPSLICPELEKAQGDYLLSTPILQTLNQKESLSHDPIATYDC